MKIELQIFTIQEVYSGYTDKDDEGIFGYGGKLNIRPEYQRNFVYHDKERDAVINTILNGFPLNLMYWVKNDDGSFELLDGQQRTISFCKYVNGDFSIKIGGMPKAFQNLTNDDKERILNYKLMIYVCEGSDTEKIKWFETINIPGLEHKKQELRNATYPGPWLSDAKRWFSKRNCPAYKKAAKYLVGEMDRQAFLETALYWISKGWTGKDKIENYMAAHQNYPNANELWVYFDGVITWLECTFPDYNKLMKGLNWGKMYEQFKGETLDTAKLRQEVSSLLKDKDVTNRKGIYEYVLTRDERVLNIRKFDDDEKEVAYERQGHKCLRCGKEFPLEEMHADHITPWSKGGPTSPENCQILCADCNRKKGNI